MFILFNYFSEQDHRPTNLSLKNTISVVNAAGRWRRKYRKTSVSHSSRSNSAVRPKSRTTSAANQSKKQSFYGIFFKARCCRDLHGPTKSTSRR